MAKTKLSKAERAVWEKDLSTLRAAVAQCEQVLKDDDEAAKAVEAASERSTIKGIAERDGNSAAFYAIRLAGGHSIADAVHGRKDG